MEASASVVPKTGPCRGRNCGKNENAKTAAFGLAAIVTREARNAAAGVRPDGSRRAKAAPNSASSSLAPRAAPRGHPEVHEHDRAHDVQAQVQPPVGAQQPGQARPGGQRPAEDADLVAGHGGQPGGAPVPHRPVQEQRRGRPRQRRDGQAGQQERGQHREHVPEDLAHPPIRPSAGDGTQSVFRVESAQR